MPSSLFSLSRLICLGADLQFCQPPGGTEPLIRTGTAHRSRHSTSVRAQGLVEGPVFDLLLEAGAPVEHAVARRGRLGVGVFDVDLAAVHAFEGRVDPGVLADAGLRAAG